LYVPREPPGLAATIDNAVVVVVVVVVTIAEDTHAPVPLC